MEPRKLELLPGYRNAEIVAPEENGKFYTINGRDYRRVTSVLKVINKFGIADWIKRMSLDYVEDVLLRPGMLQFAQEQTPESWTKFVKEMRLEAEGAADRYRDAAADRGTDVHSDIERCIIDHYEPMTPKGRQGVHWLRHKGFEVLELEFTVWDIDLGLAGTVDVIGYDPSEDSIIVVDWKTGSGPYSEMMLQVGCYASFLSKMTGLEVGGGYIVMLREDQARGYRVKDMNLGANGYWNANSLQLSLTGGGKFDRVEVVKAPDILGLPSPEISADDREALDSMFGS